MSKTLHILNGDSTLYKFQNAGIDGDTYVWKDVLSNGPVDPDFGSESFWSKREKFMSKEFELSEGEYKKVGQQAFEKMVDTIDQYDEIVLWFEYDLFCQINMIALMHWLSKTSYLGTTTLICAGKIDDSDTLYALGEIETKHYKELYENRLKLGSRELGYATDVYEAYTSDTPDDLFTFVLMPFAELPYLPQALESHFLRFPSKQTGLTEIEEQFIAFIQAGENDKRKLVGKMLRWQKHQGFGDLQYFNILKRMSPLFEDIEHIALKPNFNPKLIDRSYYLGGALVKNWCWDQNEEALIPQESAL